MVASGTQVSIVFVCLLFIYLYMNYDKTRQKQNVKKKEQLQSLSVGRSVGGSVTLRIELVDAYFKLHFFHFISPFAYNLIC